MNKKEKELLLQDLCGRLPYGVIGLYTWKNKKSYNRELTGGLYDELKSSWNSTEDSQFLPYLRPMSSMTDEEKSWYESLRNALTYQENGEYDLDDFNELNDFLNRRKLDKYGLIEKGLALEAKEGMYND